MGLLIQFFVFCVFVVVVLGGTVSIDPSNVYQNSGTNGAFCVDGNPSTYCTTSMDGPEPAVWQAYLGGNFYIASVSIAKPCDYSSCPYRLQDIQVEIMQFTGNLSQDFNFSSGGTRSDLSAVLNVNGRIDTFSNLVDDLSSKPDYIRGNLVRILRLPSTSTSPPTPTTNEWTKVLAMGEVVVVGTQDPCDFCSPVGGECVGTYPSVSCRCLPGYYGDGTNCQPTLGDPPLVPFMIREVTHSWRAIDLPLPPSSDGVVLCSALTPDPHLPVVIRLRPSDTLPTSFDIRADYPLTPGPPVTAHCLSLTQGVYNGLEAAKLIISSDTNTLSTGNTSTWSGTRVSFKGRYTNPVVFGQVMSAFDDKWLSFWASDVSSTHIPPSPGSTSMKLGKHCGTETRQSLIEIVGYIVMEKDSLSRSQILSDLLTYTGDHAYDYSISPSHIGSVVVSPAGVNNPSWPVLTHITGSTFGVSMQTNLPMQLAQETFSYLLYPEADILMFPADICADNSGQCPCIAQSGCAWCANPGTGGGSCYPRDTQAYCEGIGSGWVVQNSSCYPAPAPDPAIPSPEQQQQPQQPQVPAPQPQAVPVFINSCQDLDLCACLSNSLCSWCKSKDAAQCLQGTLHNQAMCQNKNGIWIESTNDCGQNATNQATHTLSAFAQTTSTASAIAALTVGVLLVLFALGLLSWFVILKPFRSPSQSFKVLDNL